MRFRSGSKGLSPRLRGNLDGEEVAVGVTGSIPAPAGEPEGGQEETPPKKVYPRACGGTLSLDKRHQLLQGLSPRLRGNLVAHLRIRHIRGSIPAPAGEPADDNKLPAGSAVYPRACGGTGCESGGKRTIDGLSPRLRGNRLRASRTARVPGSIPAPAGEPIAANSSLRRATVYPRACGGTFVEGEQFTQQQGLSPSLRGNPGLCRLSCNGARSIPAPAGEPRYIVATLPPWRVYPRACGGTAWRLPLPHWWLGLSPRLRGNRCLRRR